MNEYRYILEPYEGKKTRYLCPGCNDKEKTFVRYIDKETGEQLDPSFGKCNRADNCGYHKLPPLETKYFFVQFDKCIDYSDKAFQIKQNEKFVFVPKSQVNEISENGCYISEWYLNEQDKANKIKATNEYKYFANGEPVTIVKNSVKPATPQQKPVSFIPVNLFKASLKGYKENNFIKYLITLFGTEITKQLISLYFIGSSKHWNGATIFWQIDIQGNVRTGKIMLYSHTTGKRSKDKDKHPAWVHNYVNQPEFELQQCLFGEHLLKDKTKPVAIVESEKTAVIASVYLSQFIWLAAGNKEGLNLEKCKVLKGRNVTLFPDLNAFELWTTRAKELSQFCRVSVSDLLERKATETEKQQGLDLADYLTRFEFRKPVQGNKPEPDKQPAEQHRPAPNNISKSETETLISEPLKQVNDRKSNLPQGSLIPIPEPLKQVKPWDISEIEQFFQSAMFLAEPIRLNQCTMINNIHKFIDSHLEIVKANNGNPTYEPYFNRLIKLKEIIKQ